MKLRLFYSKREFAYFALFIIFIFTINLAFKYHEFLEFRGRETAVLDAQILNAYDKTSERGHTYTVLKLKSGANTIYTTTKIGRKFERMSHVKVHIITKNLKFLDFVKARFYVPNYKIKESFYEHSAKSRAINFIRAQHADSRIADFYSALYFATQIPKDLRDSVTRWGIAHVIAVSGFHLGIIFSTFFLIFAPIYRYFQSRYFPYRNLKFDLSVCVIALMICYLFVLDFTPSFLRSLAMCCVGFFLVWRNFYVVNFTNLFLTLAILLAFFPHLAFSVGFYFSALGVLYIFLYSHYFWPKFCLWQNLIVFNLYVWFSMNVAVYFFFPTASLQQLCVIPISYIFIVFYPLSVILHLLEFGGIFDGALGAFFDFGITSYKAIIPLWLFVCANVCTALALRFKYAALACPLIGILPIFFIAQ